MICQSDDEEGERERGHSKSARSSEWLHLFLSTFSPFVHAESWRLFN